MESKSNSDGTSDSVEAQSRLLSCAVEENLPGNLYRLLLKNVSRDDPLSPEEASELKAFRETLTTEQWKAWLKFARDERHALKKQRKKSSPPKLKTLAKDPALLLQTLNEISDQSNHSNKSAENVVRRHEVSWSDYVGEHVLTEVISQQETNESEETKHFENNENPRSIYKYVSGEPDVVYDTPHPSEVDSFHHTALERSQREPSVQIVSREICEASLSSNAVSESASCAEIQRMNVPSRRSSDLVHLAAAAEVSLQRSSIAGRSSRSQPVSAPRERPQSAQPMSSGWSTSEWMHSGEDRQHERSHNIGSTGVHSPKQRRVAGSLFSLQDRPHQHGISTQAKQQSGFAYILPSKSDDRKADALRSRDKHSELQSAVSPLESTGLADAAEIARSTSFRLDAAYSAARCLLSSMTEQQSAGNTSTHEIGESADPDQRAQITFSILSEMVSSIEKSRQSLNQLTCLHTQPSIVQHQQSPYVSRKYPASNSYGSIHDKEVRRLSDSGFDDLRLESACQAPFKSAGESPLAKLRFGGENSQLLESDQNQMQEMLRENWSGSPQQTSFSSSVKRPPDPWLSEDFEGTSGIISPGVALHTRHSRSKPIGEFSPWNKHVVESALNESAEALLDPVSNLQGKLFEAADFARRSAALNTSVQQAFQSTSKSIALPKYSYNSTGYVWEGVRHNCAQGPVSRVCLVHGPLVKSFDDYPIRVDAESCVVDVVWREPRIDVASQLLNTSRTNITPSITASAHRVPISPLSFGKSPTFGSSRRDTNHVEAGDGESHGIQYQKGNTVLRRERFSFDDIFSGQTADGRLSMYCRQRARKALEGSRNMAIVCLGCGDQPSAGESSIEPPISCLLGGGGGTGLISSVLDEIFRYARPLSVSMQETGKAYPGSFPTAAASPFVASKAAFEQLKNQVTLSAIILSDRGEVFDLLSSSNHQSGEGFVGSMAANLKRRKSDGRVVLCNASRLELQAPSDFDRIMGLLLGKRTALQGVLSALKQQQRVCLNMVGTGQQLGSVVEPFHDILASIDPWAAFNSKSADNSMNGACCASTMLITLAVTGGQASSARTSVDFNFISPCGKNWSNPGADINILAEMISGLPNLPPPSLLKASAIGLLLMDPRNPATDFVNIVNINRERGVAGRVTKGSDAMMVNGALNSLRVIAQIAQ